MALGGDKNDKSNYQLFPYMETGAGSPDPQKPVIGPNFTPTIAILTGTDTLFLTKMQTGEKRLNRSSP